MFYKAALGYIIDSNTPRTDVSFQVNTRYKITYTFGGFINIANLPINQTTDTGLFTVEPR
jgi:hypothetical protein